MGDDRTHYEVLGVSSAASRDEIRAAYIGKARQTHPDVSGGESVDPAGDDMRLVNEAYRVLRDGQSRARYDQQLRRDASPVPSPGSSVEGRSDEVRDDHDDLVASEPLFTTDSFILAVLARGWPLVVLAIVIAIFVFSAYATGDDDSPDQPSSDIDSTGHAWQPGDCLVRLPQPSPVPCGDEHDATVVALAFGDASCSQTVGWFEADVPGPARLCIVYER